MDFVEKVESRPYGDELERHVQDVIDRSGKAIEEGAPIEIREVVDGIEKVEGDPFMVASNIAADNGLGYVEGYVPGAKSVREHAWNSYQGYYFDIVENYDRYYGIECDPDDGLF